VLSLSSPPRTPGAGRSGALEERKNARRADRFRCSSLPLLHSAALSASSATSAVKPGSNAVVRMQLVGARRDARVEGVEPLPGRVNYFLGQDPSRWQRNVPTYRRVRYEQVYPGVDLVYYGN